LRDVWVLNENGELAHRGCSGWALLRDALSATPFCNDLNCTGWVARDTGLTSSIRSISGDASGEIWAASSDVMRFDGDECTGGVAGPRAASEHTDRQELTTARRLDPRPAIKCGATPAAPTASGNS